MMLIWTIILLAILWWTGISLASAGQVPVIDGVLGGVRNFTMRPAVPMMATVDPDVLRSPGKLRIVENSGVCGEAFLFFCVMVG
jgi:hypothetical protein